MNVKENIKKMLKENKQLRESLFSDVSAKVEAMADDEYKKAITETCGAEMSKDDFKAKMESGEIPLEQVEAFMGYGAKPAQPAEVAQPVSDAGQTPVVSIDKPKEAVDANGVPVKKENEDADADDVKKESEDADADEKAKAESFKKSKFRLSERIKRLENHKEAVEGDLMAVVKSLIDTVNGLASRIGAIEGAVKPAGAEAEAATAAEPVPAIEASNTPVPQPPVTKESVRPNPAVITVSKNDTARNVGKSFFGK